jgi:hypothetical protein
MTLSTADGPAFIRLMKHYVIDYTNRNDQSQTPLIMEPDYLLRMGEHFVRGRDTNYHAATAKQMDQFPDLCLTVHEIATSGDRLVMRFSEHGASRLHKGRKCVWGGIGLYAWNGRKLVRNAVEQDYLSRRRQLGSGMPHAVDHPAIAPWNTAADAPDPEAEAIVRAWLEDGMLARTPGVLLDDAWTGATVSPLIDQTHIELNDFFSCGRTVAFHLAQHGTLLPDGDVQGEAGTVAFLHMAGLVHVAEGRVATGRIIRNRLDLARRLARPGA